MENQGFDIVLRYTPCQGWCCLYVFKGIEKARGRMHREFEDAVFEAAGRRRTGWGCGKRTICAASIGCNSGPGVLSEGESRQR
jgi:hypothetical protein